MYNYRLNKKEFRHQKVVAFMYHSGKVAMIIAGLFSALAIAGTITMRVLYSDVPAPLLISAPLVVMVPFWSAIGFSYLQQVYAFVTNFDDNYPDGADISVCIENEVISIHDNILDMHVEIPKECIQKLVLHKDIIFIATREDIKGASKNNMWYTAIPLCEETKKMFTPYLTK